MNMPGFTAEASVYVVANHYSAIAVGVPKSVAVHPQLVPGVWEWPLGHEISFQDIPPGGGARLPPSPTRCDWYRFCCFEFGDESCCKRWHLQCVPE